jgi:4,5-DOPA dioxygenase extradiol
MTKASDLFVTHGSPTLAVEESPARRFLTDLGPRLANARAIIVVSAHWEANQPTVGAAKRLSTIHDFRGFPESLYAIRYPATGAPDVAAEVVSGLKAAGYDPALDEARGLDHGAWVPLMLALPDAEVPVVPVSLLAGKGPAAHIALGQALAPLRDEGVAILASGSITHNLSFILGHDDPPPAWVSEFADWLAEGVAADDRTRLADYRRLAPHACLAHPHDEHLMPFYVALGAGGAGARIHASTTYGTLAMDAYAFA